MQIIFLLLFLGMIAFAVYAVMGSSKRKNILGTEGIMKHELLEQHVKFYQRLDHGEKERFRKEAGDFLRTVAITPINTTVTDLDKMLIAASAVIPMFYFRGWTYPNLEEVLLYNDHFNMNFQSDGDEDRNIMGLVGTGAYKNKMILSKTALQAGFESSTDRSNTAIHEFVHLIDAADGATDGVPQILLDKMYTVPWLELIHREMERVRAGHSDMNPYGLTNKTEFFAVASEYFFEHPEQFKEKHPELFEMMQKIFRTAG